MKIVAFHKNPLMTFWLAVCFLLKSSSRKPFWQKKKNQSAFLGVKVDKKRLNICPFNCHRLFISGVLALLVTHMDNGHVMRAFFKISQKIGQLAEYIVGYFQLNHQHNLPLCGVFLHSS